MKSVLIITLISLLVFPSICSATYIELTRVPTSCSDSDGDCLVTRINSDNNNYEEINLKTDPYGWLNVTDWNQDVPTTGTELTNVTLFVNWTNSSATQTGNVYTEYYNSTDGFSSCTGPIDGCHVSECQETCSIEGQTIDSHNSLVARFRGEDLDRLFPALGKIDYIYMITYYNDLLPNWRRQQTNVTGVSAGTINFSAEGYDIIGLSYAWLETNESGGTWKNYTGSLSGNYGSPMYLSDVSTTWTQTNFSWQNNSVSETWVGWRIWYNDTVGGANSTDISVFSVDAVESDFINITTNATSGEVGQDIQFTGYWNDTVTGKLLIDDSSSFTNCNYHTTSGCLCSSSAMLYSGLESYESSCIYTLQEGDVSSLSWYARICDASGNCDKNITSLYNPSSTQNNACERGPGFPTSPTDCNSSATSDDYLNITTEDNDWWNTSIADIVGENDSQIYVFNVTESASLSTNVTVAWEGFGNIASGYYTNISFWNWSSENWYEVDNVDCSSESDSNLTGSITSSISDFLNTSTGHVAILATTLFGKNNGEACSSGDECTSTFCVDGVCCNVACDGNTCERCDSYSQAGAGTCGYVSSDSEDPDNECTEGSATNDGCRSDYCSGSGYSCGIQTSGDGGCPVCQTCSDGDIGCENHDDNSQDYGCSSQCDACQSGSCGNADVGTDPGNDCYASNICSDGCESDNCADNGWCDHVSAGSHGNCPKCGYCDGSHWACQDITSGEDTTSPGLCQNPYECSACDSCNIPCPVVYSWNGENYVEDVAILNKLVGKDAEKTQYMQLKKVRAIDGEIRLEIREEKQEISYIDWIYLEVNDTKDENTLTRRYFLEPLYESQSNILEDDGKYLVTHKGDIVVLRFRGIVEKEEGWERKIFIFSDGYYNLVEEYKPLIPSLGEYLGYPPSRDLLRVKFGNMWRKNEILKEINAVREEVKDSNENEETGMSISRTLHTDYVELFISADAGGSISVSSSETGNITVSIDYPTSNVEIVQNETFWVNTTVTCVDADCGTVYGVLRYNASGAEPDTNISTVAATPLWTSSSNAQSCGNMNQNDVCMKNWSVNASGWFLQDYALDVNFSTSGGISNDTENAEIRIINSYQIYYGNATGNLTLSDTTGNYMTLFTLGNANGVVFVADADSIISWGELVEIGKDTGGSNSTDDFEEIDSLLNISDKDDSLNKTYSSNGSQANLTTSMIVFNTTQSYVPVARNIDNSSFYTGILWDSSDDQDADGEFDSTDQEDLVFVVKLAEGGACYGGDCDYEIKVPYNLKSYKEGTEAVGFYVMYL